MSPHIPTVVHLVGAGVGGAEKQLVALLRHRDPSVFHHEVFLVREGPLRSTFEEIVATRNMGKRRGVDLRFYGRLIHELHRRGPEILHTWTETPGLWGPTAARLAGVPFVVMGEVALQEWKGPAHLLADRLNYKVASRVVANAAAVADAAVARGAARDRTQVVPLGVEAVPARTPLRAMHRSRSVVLLGRFDHRKGHDVLVAAMPQVLARLPETRFILAGPAVAPEEKAVLARARHQVAEQGLTPAVTFEGPVDVGPLLDTCGVLVVPSTSEGMPNIILEGMARGIPVVASSVGGIPEFLTERTGWLVPPRDPQRLAAALVDALTAPDEADLRASAARDVARGATVEASMRRWEAVYRSLIANTPDVRCA